MSLKFNLNRPKISDEEIDGRRDFDNLVKKFKENSLKKARGDESWWKNKKITYSAVIAGITVVCTVTYLSIQNKQQNNTTKHETLITQKNTKPNPKKYIEAPNKKLAIPYEQFKVNNAKGAILQSKGETKIIVPKNCFVNKNGNNIVGEVSIQYREFNDLHEIIASGIPMQYDSAQQHNQLKSAGMFDIKGSQNNEPVFINKNNPIQVQYASNNAEDKFNQYYLDTLAQNWSYIRRDNIKSNNTKSLGTIQSHESTPTIEKLKNEIGIQLPKKIDSVKIICNQQINKLPTATKPNAPQQIHEGRPVFQIDRDAEDFPELRAFDNVVFEVGAENKNYTKDLHDITWSDLKISEGPDKGKNYWLNLSYRAKKVSLIVYPVFSGANYKKAYNIYETKLNEYKRLQEKRLTEEKRLIKEMEIKQAAYLKEIKDKEAALLLERKKIAENARAIAANNLSSNFNQLNSKIKTQRIFEVFNFGIYNSDCAEPLPQENIVKPMFVSIENQNPLLPDMVYLVNKTNSTVIGLNPQNGFEFGVKPNDNYLLCVFQKNDIHICSSDLFLNAIQNDKHQFLVKSITKESQNLNDFKKALNL